MSGNELANAALGAAFIVAALRDDAVAMKALSEDNTRELVLSLTVYGALVTAQLLGVNKSLSVNERAKFVADAIEKSLQRRVG